MQNEVNVESLPDFNSEKTYNGYTKVIYLLCFVSFFIVENWVIIIMNEFSIVQITSTGIRGQKPLLLECGDKNSFFRLQ